MSVYRKPPRHWCVMFVGSVGREFRQGTVGMTRLCSVMSGLPLETHEAGMTQQLDAWMIWKFLHSEVSLEPDRLEHWAQLGLLARVPTHGLSVWLGLPHRHGWSRSAFHDLSLEIAKHRFHHSLLVKASTRLLRFKTQGRRSHLLMGGWSGHSAEEHVEWQRLWPSLESTTRPNRR